MGETIHPGPRGYPGPMPPPVTALPPAVWAVREALAVRHGVGDAIGKFNVGVGSRVVQPLQR